MPTLLFDLDDTILSHDGVTAPAWEQTFDKFANQLTPHTKQKVLEKITHFANIFWSDPERHRIGRLNIKEARRTVISQTFNDLKIDNTNLINQFVDHFSILREQLMHPFPKAIETLRYFQSKGFLMALITNGAKELQTAKINRFNLRTFFQNILIEGEFGKGKPDPEVFLYSLDKLNSKIKDTWMIGDSLKYDIGGAQALGIRTAWNNWSNKPLPPNSPLKPDLTVPSIASLKQYFFDTKT